MMDIQYDSPQAIKRLLETHELAVKKRFGQNFLVNGDVRRRIIDALGIEGGETVWEIGPGLGSLTHGLLQKDIRLFAFEIDRGFIRVLQDVFEGYDNLTVIAGDFIHTWGDAITRSGEPDLIVGNLPYSSAAAIFLALIEGEVQARRIVCTVQKEGARRMTARPGAPDYGSFTVLCSLMWEIRRFGDLKPGSFFPSPRVQSTMIEMVPKGGGFRVPVAYLLAVTRALFASRRKTIRNNVKALANGRGIDPEVFYAAADRAEVDIEARPETLEPERVESLLFEMFRVDTQGV